MKHKTLLKAFGFFAAVTVIIRVVQLLFCIDPATGFFVKSFKCNLFNLGMIFFLVAAVASILFMTIYLSHRQPKRRPEANEFPKFKLASLSLGAFLVIHGFFYFISALPSGIVIAAIGALVSLLAALFFIFNAVLDIESLLKPLSIAPIVFFVFLTIKQFVGQSGVSNIFENILTLITLCTALLFFTYHGKVLSKIKFRSACKGAFATGLCASLLCFLNSLPNLLLIAIGKGDILHNSNLADSLNYLLVGAYILIFTLSLYSKQLSHISKKRFDSLDMELPEASTSFFHESDDKHY